MIRTYTHWFLMGGVLCTDTTDNESMSAAADMFAADIKGITVPGYTVVPDIEIVQLREDKARLFAELESVKRVANKQQAGIKENLLGMLIMLREAPNDATRNACLDSIIQKLTETQQAAQRISGQNDGD